MIDINIRSLAPQIDLLRTCTDIHGPDIVTFSEMWLSRKIADTEIKLPNYVLCRADRCIRGGGVATYVLSNWSSELITPHVDPKYFECLFVKVIQHAN